MSKELEALERLTDDVLDVKHYYKQFSSSEPVILQDKKLIQTALEELKSYKDIEAELGIEFSMLDKICKNGVYCYKRSIKDFNTLGKRLGNIIHIQNSDIHIEFFGVYKEKRMGVSIMGCIDYVYHSLPIKDYGITWALTKAELVKKENTDEHKS